MISKKVNIFHSKIRDRPIISNDGALLKNLPSNLLAKSNRYVKWQDRELTIMGKLLLIEGLKLYGLHYWGCLEKLRYTKYGRPYLDLDLDLELDFNISHSGEYVICALARDMRLGVDIEKITKIDVNSLSQVFTQNELTAIGSSKKTEIAFYNYWTIKECVIKAMGKGLSIPPVEVKIDGDQQANCNNEIWHVQNLQIDDLYASHIAMEYEQVKLKYHFINFI